VLQGQHDSGVVDTTITHQRSGSLFSLDEGQGNVAQLHKACRLLTIQSATPGQSSTQFLLLQKGDNSCTVSHLEGCEERKGIHLECIVALDPSALQE
jgi:hypothetical protein